MDCNRVKAIRFENGFGRVKTRDSNATANDSSQNRLADKALHGQMLPQGHGARMWMGSSEEPLQLDFAIVLHQCQVNSPRHRDIVDEIQPGAGLLTVPRSMEVVTADVQIEGGFVHTTLIGSITISLKVSHT
jgi:hypothetical protein